MPSQKVFNCISLVNGFPYIKNIHTRQGSGGFVAILTVVPTKTVIQKRKVAKYI